MKPAGVERIRGQTVGHSVTIEAPPEVVWDFIGDFAGWANWNPIYPSTSGSADVGETVRFSVQLEGMKPRRAKAQFHRVLPNALLEYGMSRFAGLLRILRYVEVEALSPTRARVNNGKIMGGPLGRLMSRAIGDKAGRSLERMNEALKTVAERKWLGHPG